MRVGSISSTVPVLANMKGMLKFNDNYALKSNTQSSPSVGAIYTTFGCTCFIFQI